MARGDNYWTRFSDQRFGRRTILRTAATGAVGGAAFAVVGCGGDDDDDDTGSNGGSDSTSTATTGGQATASPAGGGLQTPVAGITDYPSYTSVVQAAEYIQRYNWRNLPPPNSPPRRGGDYEHAVGLIPPHFDPFGPLVNSYQLPTNLRQIYNQVTRLAMDWDDDLDKATPEAELAETWEQPDDTTITFTLREGVKFQNVSPLDGRLLTSEDVKYSWDAYRETPISGYFEGINSIETPDDRTVMVKFATPSAFFLNLMSGPSTSILPPELDEAGRRENPVGTGPFQLQGGSWTLDQEVKYVRNPDYWEVRDGIQLPYLDSVKTVYPPDPTVALEGFRNGQYDSTAYANTFALLDSVLESHPDTIVQIVSDHPSTTYYLGLNHDNPKWQDPRVRQALSYGIDQQQVIDIGLEGSAAPGCLVDWASMGYTFPPQLSEMNPAIGTYNPEEAKALLSAAGVDDLEVTLLFVSTDTRGQAIFGLMQAQLQAAGITLKAETRDATSVSNALYSGQVEDAIMTTQLPAGPDADVFTYQFLHSQGPSNWFHVNIPELDEATLRQRSILDVTERQAAVKDVWTLAMEQMPQVPLASPAYIRARHPYLNNWQNHRYLDPIGWGAQIMGMMWFSEDAPA